VKVLTCAFGPEALESLGNIMNILDTYKLKKLVDKLLKLQQPGGPEFTQLVTKIKQIGEPAVPKLLEAFETHGNRERVAMFLVPFVDNDTLPSFLTALTTASGRIAAGVFDVLSRADTYDPNRLLTLFANPKLDNAELGKLLLQHKHRLQPSALLRTLSTANKNRHTTILRLLDQAATEESIPELVQRLRTEDAAVRFHIARTLCRFKTHTVRDTLTRLLADPHKNVRLLALEGLLAMHTPFDTASLCRLIEDADETIRAKALHALLQLLQDESEEVRQHAVEGLSTMRNLEAIKYLLQALKDKEWWVTVRVADALATHGGPNLVESTLTLLQDDDTFIRQCVFEIIHTLKDERAFTALVSALRDKDVRERAVEALAALEDKRAVPMFIRMLERDTEACIIAVRALVALKEPQAIHPLLVQLQNPEKAVRQEVLRALAMLTNAEYARDVLQAIMAVRDTAEDDLKELANRMATSIIKRFGSKVIPRSEAAEASKKPAEAGAAAMPTAAPGQAGAAADGGKARTGMTVEVNILEPGMILADRYRVIRRVGQGGFSTVFLVDDTMVHEDVILKILNPQIALGEDMVKRFIQELRYARKVTHENVIRIHDFITLGSAYAISMEYFPSHTLADELRDGTPLNIKRGLKIIWDVCRGIGAAHQVNIVHRDVKPLNILLNDQNVVKVVDFGVAAVTSQMGTRLTRAGTLLGTPTYVAPEQVRSRAIDARTDIYSLGVVMYECFTGRPPYLGDDMSVLFQHVEGNVTPPQQLNSDIPSPLAEIILKTMAVDPDQRFQSMDELRKSLVEFSRQLK
jgi:serine/threonine-protein kinase